MMSDEKAPAEAAAEKEAERAERKAELQALRDAQYLVDLEALDALEIELGDSNVCSIDLPFTPGLPTLVAARCPTDAEVKRFQSRVRKKREDDDEPDSIKAAQELAAACRKYPDSETYAKILKLRPMISVQLGVAAAKLAAGRVRAEGKG